MAAGRSLPSFVLPLAHVDWELLRFDGQAWFLIQRQTPHAEQALSRVQVALALPGRTWLRLQWGAAGWRRYWPFEIHVWIAGHEHAQHWPLIHAALAQYQGRTWLGGR
jgi:hypothetical protein